MASSPCRTSLRWSPPPEPRAAADLLHVINAVRLIPAADEPSPAPRCPPKLPMSHTRHHRCSPPTSPAPKVDFFWRKSLFVSRHLFYGRKSCKFLSPTILSNSSTIRKHVSHPMDRVDLSDPVGFDWKR